MPKKNKKASETKDVASKQSAIDSYWNDHYQTQRWESVNWQKMAEASAAIDDKTEADCQKIRKAKILAEVAKIGQASTVGQLKMQVAITVWKGGFSVNLQVLAEEKEERSSNVTHTLCVEGSDGNDQESIVQLLKLFPAHSGINLIFKGGSFPKLELPWPNIVELHVVSQKLSLSQLEAFKKTIKSLSKLQSLQLRGIGFADAKTRQAYLVEIAKLKLHELSLEICGLTDADMAILLPLQCHNTNLKSLKIPSGYVFNGPEKHDINCLTDSTVIELARFLTTNTSIEFLDLSHHPGYGKAAIEQLAAVIKDNHVIKTIVFDESQQWVELIDVITQKNVKEFELKKCFANLSDYIKRNSIAPENKSEEKVVAAISEQKDVVARLAEQQKYLLVAFQQYQTLVQHQFLGHADFSSYWRPAIFALFKSWIEAAKSQAPAEALSCHRKALELISHLDKKDQPVDLEKYVYGLDHTTYEKNLVIFEYGRDYLKDPKLMDVAFEAVIVSAKYDFGMAEKNHVIKGDVFIRVMSALKIQTALNIDWLQQTENFEYALQAINSVVDANFQDKDKAIKAGAEIFSQIACDYVRRINRGAQNAQADRILNVAGAEQYFVDAKDKIDRIAVVVAKDEANLSPMLGPDVRCQYELIKNVYRDLLLKEHSDLIFTTIAELTAKDVAEIKTASHKNETHVKIYGTRVLTLIENIKELMGDGYDERSFHLLQSYINVCVQQLNPTSFMGKLKHGTSAFSDWRNKLATKLRRIQIELKEEERILSKHDAEECSFVLDEKGEIQTQSMYEAKKSAETKQTPSPQSQQASAASAIANRPSSIVNAGDGDSKVEAKEQKQLQKDKEDVVNGSKMAFVPQ